MENVLLTPNKIYKVMSLRMYDIVIYIKQKNINHNKEKQDRFFSVTLYLAYSVRRGDLMLRNFIFVNFRDISRKKEELNA